MSRPTRESRTIAPRRGRRAGEEEVTERSKLPPMPTFLCTAKYRKAFGLPERLPTAEVDEGALGPWYANTLNVGSQRFLHYMSGPALLSVIVVLRDRHSGEQRFVRSLTELLADLGVPESWIAREAELLGSVQYGRASDRSNLGSLRDQAYLASHRLRDDQFSLAEVNRELAETPCGPRDYACPKRMAPERLAARWRWERGT